MPSNFVKFTRVYTDKASGATKPQKITISADAVASFRPSNAIEGQRATIAMLDGTEYAVQEKYSDVQRSLGVR